MKKASKLIFGIILFLVIASLLSLWAGLVWRNSLVILVVSLMASYLVLKKIKLPENPSKIAWLLAFVAIALAAHPFLLLHPFYDASADPAATIVSLSIQETIPSTYAPFSDIAFTYELGFPLVAKLFIDLFPTIPPYAVTWGLGILFVLLQALMVYFLARKFFKTEQAGLLGLAFFAGSKLIYQNMYWGQFSWMMATVFFLAFLWFLFEDQKPMLLLFPAIFVTHPGPAFYTILIGVLLLLFLKNTRKHFLPLLGSLLIALPAFWISYLPLVQGALAKTADITFNSKFAAFVLAIPPWIGITFITAVLASFWVIQTKRETQDVFWLTVFASSLALILVLGWINTNSASLLAGRIIELLFFSALFLSVSFLVNVSWFKKIKFEYVLGAVLILGLVLFFTSTTLTHLRMGSKITPEEAEFAQAFKEFDPDLKVAFIFSKNNAKIGEVSNKIPYHVKSGWYLPYGVHSNLETPAQQKLIERENTWNRIVTDACAECATKAPVDYIVVNTTFVEMEFNLDPVFTYGTFLVYKN
jgi:hypothetical protein